MRWRALASTPTTIRDVIVTHLHYDHAGNLDRFPNARFHLQDREMSYATGRCMCHGLLRHPFSVEHVTLMVRHVFSERVTFHAGDGEVAPGVTRASRRRPFRRPAGGAGRDRARARWCWRRTPRTITRNMHRRSPFPIVYNVGDMFEGWEIVAAAGRPSATASFPATIRS